MKRALHYLRIGWTVLCGTAFVLSVMMWTPSYKRPVNLTGFHHWITVLQGVVYIDAQFDVSPNLARPLPNSIFTNTGAPITPYGQPTAIPMWVCTVIPISLSIIPWLQWPHRFSLRTLLIFTTLVALVLGMVVYFTRN